MNAFVASTEGLDALVRVTAPCGQLIGRKRGTKRGTKRDEVAVFKGIPYAQPPVGVLRWRPPQRMTRWEGERLALEFGPAPIQHLPSRSSLMYRLNHDDANALVMSEDCLYLNVWTPSVERDTNLPVLVWIHGGANRTGHGGQALFDGSRLAARGMVVVTVNMRLGALGFLSLPQLAEEDAHGASGNYGVQDVVAALEWVQENIAAFGGDSSRVTIAGNSAGAAMVTHLMAAPSARGYFRAAIGQSLSAIFRPELRMTPHHVAAEAGLAAMSSLATSLDALRDLPATAFLHTPPQNVVIDGRLLTEDTVDVFMDGRQARVPLLVGWNADEGSLYATQQALQELRLAHLDAHARAVLEAAYAGVDGEWAGEARRRLVGDRRFAYPVWRWARTHAETSGAPTWAYEFDHRLPLPDRLAPPPDGGDEYGAFHTAELPYTWDNLAARPWAWSDADHEVARCLADTWTRFVVSGDPNGQALPLWPSFDLSKQQHLMRLGAHPEPIGTPRRQAFEVFDQLYFSAVRSRGANQ
ncbi:carboxylesterase/lipase family protein [Paraburkholderia sp. J94]|uniref:carboxylesterase/lipase family protein n=1 Tax=Paraburkholderia sp. J94 TaxID=2805441 RepID=UPI002AB0B8BC|nr:carboxylesterase family protein [Paraburkholderia sp. J94]